MLFFVTLTYARPIDEVNARFEAHRDWLVTNTRDGRIIVAGPLDTRAGGLIVADCSDRADLDQLLAEDPFVIERLVTVDVLGTAPGLRHEDFPVRWAPDAKAIAGR
jgi:uncharacterized protein YciI